MPVSHEVTSSLFNQTLRAGAVTSTATGATLQHRQILMPSSSHQLARRCAARFLPLFGPALSLCLLTGGGSVLRAQDLAVKYYGNVSVGANQAGILTQAPDGNFYGIGGGIIRLTPEGVATTVYRFSALAGDGTNAEGSHPIGGLLLGHDGNLYGLTSKGGATGHGTVFRFTADGAATAVGSLTATPQDFGSSASYPSPIVEDRAGNFYVITAAFTSDETGTRETEAILQVSSAGAVTPFHTFNPPDADGRNPEGYGACTGLVIDGQDNLYGFTSGGGAGSLGTFYKVTPDGSATALYSYDVDHEVVDQTPAPFANRYNAIVATAGGTVYGAAPGVGGASGGPGEGTLHGGYIFKGAGGQPTPLYTFSDGIFQEDGSYRNSDGVSPGGLTVGPDGNLYGETTAGGANGSGTVFEVTPGGGFKLLYTFPPNASAQTPPTLSTDGDLFGHCSGDLGFFYRLGATLLPVFNAPALTATVTQGVPFTLQLVAANDPDAFTASGLPAGLSLDGATGVITGATTAPLGVYPVQLSASNADGSSAATLTITVQAPNPDAPVVDVPSAPISAAVGVPFSYQLAATNKPTSYQVAGLPAGLTVDPKTGLIHGLFANAGKIFLQVQAQNASGSGSANLEIDVAGENALPIVTAAVSADANATTGQAGAFTVTLSASPAQKISVAYTLKGSAVNGQDYAHLNGIVKFKAGKTSKTVVVKPQRDTGGPGKKTVKLTLQPGSGYTIGSAGAIKLKITE